MWRVFLLAALLSNLSACTSRLVVKPVVSSGSGGGLEGVFYALPKTVLLVQIPVIATEVTPGEFHSLLHVFFPFEEAPAPGVTYRLGEPTMGSFGVPDSNQVYVAVVKGGRFEDKRLAFTFGEDGTIEKMDSESDNKALEFLGQTIRSAATVGAGLVVPSFAARIQIGPTTKVEKQQESSCERVETSLENATGREDSPSFPASARLTCQALPAELQEAMLAFIKDGRKPESPLARARTFLRASTASARMAVLQKQRDELLSSAKVAIVTGDPLKTALAELNGEIGRLTQQFFGRSVDRLYWRATYQLTPASSFDSTKGGKIVDLFRFSPEAGVCVDTSRLPDAVDRFEQLSPPARAAECRAWVAVEIEVARQTQQYADTVAAAVAGPVSGERGLFYRVPGKARVVLRTRASSNMEASEAITRYEPAVAQFGPIVSLPSTTGGRKTHYVAELHSATGAMKSFSLGSEAALDKAIVSDIEAASTSVVQARQARREEAQAKRDASARADDELARLTREAELLEAQVRVRAAQAALGAGAPPRP